jgi:hypothetical protein
MPEGVQPWKPLLLEIPKNPQNTSYYLFKTMQKCDHCGFESTSKNDFNAFFIIEPEKTEDETLVPGDYGCWARTFCNPCADEACELLTKRLKDRNKTQVWVATAEFLEWDLEVKEEQLAELKEEVDELKEAMFKLNPLKRKELADSDSEDEEPAKKKARKAAPAKPGETVIDLSAD